MAVAIGIGAAELAWLAAGALAALILASPPGQRAVRQTAREVSRALERPTTIDCAPPITECERPCPPCPPNFCPQPPPTRTDIVPPSARHFPCPGTHTHRYWYQLNQNPRTCQCFCNLRGEVICH